MYQTIIKIDNSDDLVYETAKEVVEIFLRGETGIARSGDVIQLQPSEYNRQADLELRFAGHSAISIETTEVVS